MSRQGKKPLFRDRKTMVLWFLGSLIGTLIGTFLL